MMKINMLNNDKEAYLKEQKVVAKRKQEILTAMIKEAKEMKPMNSVPI
jgi:hypothetical protein